MAALELRRLEIFRKISLEPTVRFQNNNLDCNILTRNFMLYEYSEFHKCTIIMLHSKSLFVQVF